MKKPDPRMITLRPHRCNICGLQCTAIGSGNYYPFPNAYAYVCQRCDLTPAPTQGASQ